MPKLKLAKQQPHKRILTHTLSDKMADTHTQQSQPNPVNQPQFNKQQLSQWIKQQALDLGFSGCGIAPANSQNQLKHLQAYLAKGYAGDMQFLHQHHDKRANPSLLVAGTKSVISVRMDYLTTPPPKRSVPDNTRPNHAIIARYARGRDYHKLMRNRLKQLAKRIENQLGNTFTWRPFSDSAPIFEKTLAEQAGLGWTGKHTLLINQQAGSFFVLGELFTSLELAFDTPATAHCGSCMACLNVCPTQAIIAPYQLNASACIAYLTIEYQGIIAEKFRHAIGNRVFGCDDCQLICPWNSFAKLTTIADFNPRHHLDAITLLQLWQWTEAEFLSNTEGSPLRRTGYPAFMRNVAIALGNSDYHPQTINALQQRKADFDELVNVHIDWAINALSKNKP